MAPDQCFYVIDIIVLLLTSSEFIPVLRLLNDNTLDTLCAQPPISATFYTIQARIKNFELPFLRKQWKNLQQILSPIIVNGIKPNFPLHLLLQLPYLLLRFGHVYSRTQLCHELLSASTTNDPRDCDRSVRRLSVLLEISPTTEYAVTKLDRWVSGLALAKLPNLTEFAQHFAKHISPTYVHSYSEFPNSIYTIYSGDEAKGSYGLVRKIQSNVTHRYFALKTFHRMPSKKDRETSKNEFNNELAILQACNHPNLIRLVDAFETPRETRHFVTEPWAPYTLCEFLYSSDDERKEACPWFKPNDPASTAIISRLMYELANGLQYLHKRCIKHKDIKPSNILLYREDSNDVQPILADVGKSKVFREGATTGYIDSSYLFLSPEQVAKVASSLPADIWQLGCCFALLLALACRGGDAAYSLRNSVLDPSDEKRCCIGDDHEFFIAGLDSICHESQMVAEALEIVKSMLVVEPRDRPDIHAICARLSPLLS